MLVAIECTNADTGEHEGGYVDVQDTGRRRYATKAEAEAEGRTWAEDEGLPFVS
jgi:hypothetical protein